MPLEHVDAIPEEVMQEASSALAEEIAADDAQRAQEEGAPAPETTPEAAPAPAEEAEVPAADEETPAVAPAPAASEEAEPQAVVSELMARLGDQDRELRQLRHENKQFKSSGGSAADLVDAARQDPRLKQQLVHALGLGLEDVMDNLADAPPANAPPPEVQELRTELQSLKQQRQTDQLNWRVQREQDRISALATSPEGRERWELILADHDKAVPLAFDVATEIHKLEGRVAPYHEVLDRVEDHLEKEHQARIAARRNIKKLQKYYTAAEAPAATSAQAIATKPAGRAPTPDVSGAAGTSAPAPMTDEEAFLEAQRILVAESKKEE